MVIWIHYLFLGFLRARADCSWYYCSTIPVVKVAETGGLLCQLLGLEFKGQKPCIETC
jgi:hypothetical protein